MSVAVTETVAVTKTVSETQSVAVGSVADGERSVDGGLGNNGGGMLDTDVRRALADGEHGSGDDSLSVAMTVAVAESVAVTESVAVSVTVSVTESVASENGAVSESVPSVVSSGRGRGDGGSNGSEDGELERKEPIRRACGTGQISLSKRSYRD